MIFRGLLIGILVYLCLRFVVRRLFRLFLKKSFGASANSWFNTAAGGGGRAKSVAGGDALVEDPVCKTLVPKHEAIVDCNAAGEQIFFCSKNCHDKFVESSRH